MHALDIGQGARSGGEGNAVLVFWGGDIPRNIDGLQVESGGRRDDPHTFR